MIFFPFIKAGAQLFDWRKIYSGDLETYKKYNIKTAVLKKNGVEINRIEILADKNEIITSNITQTSWLIYDKQNRLSRIISKNIEIKISYADNGMILSIEKETKSGGKISISKNYRPDLNNPKNINYEGNFLDTKTGKNEFYRKRFVFNSNDSLTSFNENTLDNGYYRFYQNGTNTKKLLYENGFEIDSSYYVSPNKLNNYNFIRNKERDVITKSQDSIYIESYFQGKIESRVVKYDDLLYDEELFIPNQIRNKYIYYTANDGRYILWEIRSIHANGKVKSKYPLKRYYNLVHGKLIRNKRKIKNEIVKVRGYGGTYRKNNRMGIPEFDIYSPSVLLSRKITERVSDNLDTSEIFSHELGIIYNKLHSDTPIKKEDYLGSSISLSPRFYNFLTEFICREDYNVEITDKNGKVFTRRFFEHPDELSIILNIFIKQE
ncbi:hypothetical protein [Chryseobacterium sp. Mn2064]|uniref:hypothetical protein n=1 Tax=Chryseobacterium sp. Mn2064 TaxID=3395263 RepID=UPI003BDF8AF4